MPETKTETKRTIRFRPDIINRLLDLVDEKTEQAKQLGLGEMSLNKLVNNMCEQRLDEHDKKGK